MKEKRKNHIYNLTFIGFDSRNLPVYEDQNMRLWKDVEPTLDSNPKLCSATNNYFDGEPDTEMRDGDVHFYPDRVTWDWTRKKITDLFEKVDQIDLENIPGKVLLGYHKLYYRGKHWNSTFISNNECNLPLDKKEDTDLMELKKAISIFWPRGVNWEMEGDMLFYGLYDDSKQFSLRVKNNPNIYLHVDMQYGNADYPIRVYVYRNSDDLVRQAE